ncbi:MAG TPA: hypothetical protein VLF94_07225 [Chlamydiales bacterium]|nr:hypothetical protein [Chlamydiales bacterium]
MPRRRPDFGSGEAGAEAAQPERLSPGVPKDASSLGWGGSGSQKQWLPDAGRTDF